MENKNEDNNSEYKNILLMRVSEIIDNSNNLYDTFVNQGECDKIISDLHQKTNHFANISKDEILFIAETLNELIFATPLFNDNFYLYSNEDNNFEAEMIFFSSYDEMQKFSSKNNNCKFLCLKFRDIITLINFYNLKYETIFLTNYVLNFSTENIESFYNFYTYENTNGASNYIIGQPTESYTEAIDLLIPEFKEFEELKNVWLYHIAEFKNKNQEIVGNKYEIMYDVFVIESVEGKYIKIRDLINEITKQTNGHSIKVVLHNSDMGMLLLNNKTSPVYSK